VRLRSYNWSPRSAEQGSEWLAIHSPLFTSPEPALVGPTGAYRMWAGASFILSHTSCDRATLIHSPAAIPAIDHVGLCLVLSGTIDLFSNGADAQALAGDIVLLDLHAPIQLVRGGNGETTSELTLWIPRARLAAHFCESSGSDGHIMRSSSSGTALTAAALQALLSEVKRATTAEMDELVTGVVALAARVIALSSSGRSGTSRSAVDPPLESFSTIARFIEANLARRELGIEKITRTFGLSRASLYRLFEPVGGVASYIRTRRLLRARKELTAPGLQDHRIGPIAYRAGFQSIPVFNRAFREAYGETPRSARKAKSGPAFTATPRGRMGALSRWLLEIS
jgi:AraC-like DNA-binding protein